MAIKIGGTTVISDSFNISSIRSISGINSIITQTGIVTVYNSAGTGIGTIKAYIDLSSTGFTTSSFATKDQVSGIVTSGITTSGTNKVTIIGTGEVSNIFNGDLVTGIGITPGTSVTAGGGTVNLTLSANAGYTTTASPYNSLTFYNNTTPLSPGSVGGQLCRAWVNYNGLSRKIISCYNVSSVTYSGAGNYIINFTAKMPDNDFAIAGFANGDDVSTLSVVSQYSTFFPSTSSCRVLVAKINDSSLNDVSTVSVLFFR